MLKNPRKRQLQDQETATHHLPHSVFRKQAHDLERLVFSGPELLLLPSTLSALWSQKQLSQPAQQCLAKAISRRLPWQCRGGNRGFLPFCFI